MKQETADKITALLEEEYGEKPNLMLITKNSNDDVHTLLNGNGDDIALSLFTAIVTDKDDNPIWNILKLTLFNMIKNNVEQCKELLLLLYALVCDDDEDDEKEEKQNNLVPFSTIMGEA